MLRKVLNDDPSTISGEWRELPVEMSSVQRKDSVFSVALKYPEKNRYIDVLPYNSSRVVLSPKEENEDGYINASLINLPHSKAISSQGPLPQTFEDFWQMIWENKVRIIVMLTRLRERQRVKAHCYWPTEGSVEVIGSITIEGKETKSFEHHVVRKFVLSCGESSRSVYQIQYTDWPDFGVPTSSQSILELIDTIEEYSEKMKLKKSKKRPYVLFHCSAGIGRCGTLLGVCYALEQLKEGVSVCLISVPDIVASLREQRMGMVQTQEQYAFIYTVVNDYLRSTCVSRNRQLRQASAPSSILRKKRGLRTVRVCPVPSPKTSKSLSKTWQVSATDCTIVV